MKCKLALVAKDVIIAHDTGVPSAINIMEGIHAAAFPLLVQEISFFTVWLRSGDDPDQYDGHLIVDCAGKELVKEKISISFGPRDVVRNIAKFNGLLLPEPGELKFRCEFPAASVVYSVVVSLLTKVETAANTQG